MTRPPLTPSSGGSEPVDVLLLGPSLSAVSGVSTHLRLVLTTAAAADLRLAHFQVGSEGRTEGRLGAVLRFIWSPLSLLALMRRTRPDVVHLNTSVNKALFRDAVYLDVARAVGCRTVLNVHGGQLPADFAARSRVGGQVLRRALRAADAVVLLGEHERAPYRSFVPGVPLSVVPNAVPVPPGQSVRAPRDGALRLVYLGRLAREKGLLEAVEALALARSRGVALHWTVGGVGPDESNLRAAVADAGLQAQVDLVGPVFGEDKERLWAASDVLLFPTHAEGLPYSLLEAMAVGVVPVTCPVGAIPEVVEDGRNGLLVPVGDVDGLAAAVERLAGDARLLDALSAAARERVAQSYSSDRLAADLRALWTGLAARGSRRRGRSRTRA